MRITWITILFLVILNSCTTDPNKHIDEGKVVEGIYHSQKIGWTMAVPEGWNITHRSVSDQRTEKGLDAIKETTGLDVDDSELRQLLNFEKNRLNIFQSSLESYQPEIDGDWEVNNIALKYIIYQTYLQEGIKVDTTETTIEQIDGLDFHTFEFSLYSRNNDIILKQLMYSRLINGFDFGVNLNYNNEADKKEMLDAWMNSKFDR